MEKSYAYEGLKNRYYIHRQTQFYRFIVPPKSRVLFIGCGTGELLAALDPSVGVGLDTDKDSIAIAQSRYPECKFYAGTINTITLNQQFDYVILYMATMYADDVYILLRDVNAVCHDRTRVVVNTIGQLWRPAVMIAKMLKLIKESPKNWITSEDLEHLIYLANYEEFATGRSMFIPFYIPLLSTLFNYVLINLPLLNRASFHAWTIMRPITNGVPGDTVNVSVIVPCRNEKGNIEPAVQRIPKMGKSTEIIFVEGGSEDGTFEEMERVAAKYPDRNIKCVKQRGLGKGNAVRTGFEHARGEMLMIQDGDLTITPEDLPKFFEVLAGNQGEFVNGSRLLYPMEKGAMPMLNFLANMFFSYEFSWILGQRVRDTLAGTKVFWKRDYELIAQTRSYFGETDPFGDFDLLFGAAKLYLHITDMPVHYKKRSYGETQIRRFYHGIVLLRMSGIALWKFKIR